MSHGIEEGLGGGGILSNKLLWFCIGGLVFILVAFVMPTPQSVVDVVEKYLIDKSKIKNNPFYVHLR